ncbi:AAA ATPase domain-containing protein [Parafrankia irregularis]|uniref:AAA ATPase domain-containing protein n=1 Tax=Parafrankia irregularis TaxID=795642 RepID=A0A0S4QP57_9ACTN|nr:AAA ATPase domain-containing protein [Parafrankia irregularis]
MESLPPEEIAAVFAARFPDPLSAQQVIAQVGLPRERQPGWTAALPALAWWIETIRLLAAGAVGPDWPSRLETAAAAFPQSAAAGDESQSSTAGEQIGVAIGNVSAPSGQATGVNNGTINFYAGHEVPRRPPAFLPVAEHLASWLAPDAIHHHRATLVGRESQLRRLLDDLDPVGERVRVVLVTGPGGRGKSRLALEALRRAADRWPEVPALVLQEEATLDGIALAELPDGAASILVEDVHKRSEAHLLSLLAQAKKTPGTVLILTTRGLHHAAVNQAVHRAGLDGDRDVIELTTLDLRAAQMLVDELVADGPPLPDVFVEHLARVGCDCPLVAVVAVELARRDKLAPVPLALDQGFRDEVLLAFSDEIAGRVPEGIDQPTATRFLKYVCAIAPFRVNDHDLYDKIATLAKAPPEDLVTIRHAFREAHVLVEAHGQAWVRPEIVADEVLARAAAVGGHDSGFALRVWRALSETSSRWSLVANLAEVSWRLSETDGPDIFEPVWLDVVAQIDLTDLVEIHAFLTRATILAEVQPTRLFSLLDQLLAMLTPVQRPLGMHDLAARQVEKALDQAVPLLARCVAAKPALLAGALDHLCALALVDGRPVHQTPDHPVRLVTERLTTMDRPGSVTAARTAIEKVEAWSAKPDPLDAVRTPLFALESLVAKSAMSTVWHRDGIKLLPYLISPDKTADLRRRIRTLLIREGTGPSLRRTCEAVDLLGAALHEPAQYVGMTVTLDNILAWESEDLATLGAMSEIAEAATEPLVRRRLRDQVSWHATRARSQAVRTAALTLVTELDEHPEDDLTAALLGAPDVLLPSRRGIPVPTGGTPRADEDLGIRAEQRWQALATMWATVATALWAEHDAAGIIETLNERLRKIDQVQPAERAAPGARPLLQHLCQAWPDRLRDLANAAIGLADGPLDDYLYVVFDAWARHDSDTFSLAIPTLLHGRSGVRRAAARGFTLGWSELDTRFEMIQIEALRAGDPDLRDQLAAGTAPQLRRDPAGTAQLLADVARDAPWGITQALQAAGNYDLEAWGGTLDNEAALAILNLTQLIGWDDTNIQCLVASIARRLPAQVLTALTALGIEDSRAPDVVGLPEALDQHPTEIAAWLRRLTLTDLRPWTLLPGLVLTVLGSRPTDGAELALVDVVETAELKQLARLLRGLRQCDGLVIARPNFVSAVLARIGAAPPTELTDEIDARLRDMLHPTFWSLSRPGEAPQELVYHREQTAERARDEALPVETKAFYMSGLKWLEAAIAAETKTGDDE